MKKLITLLLAICMCVFTLSTFVACGGDGGNNDDGNGDENPGAGVTEDVWEDAKAEANFNNVTYSVAYEFKTPQNGGSGFVEIQLVDDVAAARENGEGEFLPETDPELVASVRNLYVNTVLAIVDNFDNFTYDATNDYYKASADIVYTVDVEDMTATITAKNAIVTLNEDDGIAKIVCEMTQAFTEGGVAKTFVLDTEFTFSNYGTTVIG